MPDVFGLSGTTLEGRFGVDSPIAEGGFGVVYLAQQTALERPVALKVLKTPPRFDDVAKQQFLASFASEAKTIARITHPSIVQVYDFGVSLMPSGDRAAWMALEWLTGMTLDAELTARRGSGGRTPAECFTLLRPVLAALAVVHAAGVAHRDLKPANIMLVPSPTGPTPKLLDFGIAKIMDADESPGSGQTHTRSTQVAYSPAYASPEQISQGRSGPWTDVHALGLLLTEILTDRAPLEGDTATALFQQLLHPVRPTPAKYGVLVGAWEPVLARAVAIPPAERFKDAGELLQALEAALPGATRRVISVAPALHSAADMGVMETQHAPPPAGSRPSTTTSAPITEDPPVIPGTRPPNRLGLALGALLTVVVVGALGWRATATHAETGTAAGLDVSGPPPALAASAPATPVPVAPTPAAAPSASPALSATPPPAASAPPAAAGRTGASARSGAPSPRTSAQAPPATAAPAIKPGCDPPFTLDTEGQKHFKHECYP